MKMKLTSQRNQTGVNRRQFLAAAGAGSALGSLPLARAESANASRMTRGIVDCQSHLFFPEVLELMRKRQAEPLVYDRDGTTFLKMGDWLRKVPPPYICGRMDHQLHVLKRGPQRTRR